MHTTHAAVIESDGTYERLRPASGALALDK
jgi:hypothetical protein